MSFQYYESKQNQNINSQQQNRQSFFKNKYNKNKFYQLENLLNQIVTKFQIIRKQLLQESFQKLKKNMKADRNRQLLYEAVFKNTNNLRKLKEQKKIQALLHHQKQQQFELDQGVSTIHKNSQQSQRDSRIFYENLFQKPFDLIKQNEYHFKQIFKQSDSLLNKRSKTDFSFQNSFCQMSPAFYVRNQSSKNKSSFGMIKNNGSMKKQTKKAQHIFVVRNTERRYSSSEKKPKVKYLEIPVQSNNVKIIQLQSLSRQKNKRSISLNTSYSNQLKIQSQTMKDCPNQHNQIQKCKYCKQLQKNNQMMKKYLKQSTQYINNKPSY